MEVRRRPPGDVATLVGAIDRSERVEVVYGVEHGQLVERPVAIADVPPWDPDGDGPHSVAAHVAFCAGVLADHDDAVLLAAEADGEVAGVALVVPRFEGPMAWLAFLHVSRPHRRRGVAGALWSTAVDAARAAGATSMYVSGTPTGSAVGFYLAQGCRLADPVHPALFKDEPEDIHLVCPVGHAEPEVGFEPTT